MRGRRNAKTPAKTSAVAATAPGLTQRCKEAPLPERRHPNSCNFSCSPSALDTHNGKLPTAQVDILFRMRLNSGHKKKHIGLSCKTVLAPIQNVQYQVHTCVILQRAHMSNFYPKHAASYPHRSNAKSRPLFTTQNTPLLCDTFSHQFDFRKNQKRKIMISHLQTTY